ncbi:MAG: GntR family transcriptional regulator [Alteromonadaceae bacterium]|jgi:DNA-binding transcriptional MocR family regulator|nr:GntR family transcriptional regulator [Alteromonadaceae bacterium]MBB20076.1 GntR family transcriptional regulator [Rickettsiales bacterium]
MKSSKYQDIARIIEAKIDIGEFQVGNKLPTHRALAEELDTTAVTVSKAYSLLAQENKIESFVGRGSYVADPASLSNVIRSTQSQSEYNFSILQPCVSRHIITLHNQFKSCFSGDINADLYAYSENTGLSRHKEISRLWPAKYGLYEPEVEQVHLTGGAQHALSTLIQLYTQPGDLIALEEQTYPGILSIATFLGRKVVGVKMDEQGMQPAALTHIMKTLSPKLVIIVPSHQNPTGATMSIERRQQIAHVIEASSCWLIEDDIYGFLNKEVLPAISCYVPHKSFHVSSLSKAISPGMRCGFIISPKGQSARLSAFIRAMMWLPTPLVFEVASQIIESGMAFDLADQQRQIAESRQRIFEKHFDEYCYTSQPTSYQAWLTLPDGWSADNFAMIAKSQGLLVSSASYFSVSGVSSNKVRLSVMAIDSEQHFAAGLGKLKMLLRQSPKELSPF